jgi:hypothetical protein
MLECRLLFQGRVCRSGLHDSQKENAIRLTLRKG